MMLAQRRRFTSFKTRRAIDKPRQLQKFLDTKKDTAGRYRALKALVGESINIAIITVVIVEQTFKSLDLYHQRK